MTTLLPRAYAPDAPLLQMIPDSPSIREWWKKTYQHALNDAHSHILIATDEPKVIGILTMHHAAPELPSSITKSVISAIPLTSEHSPLLTSALEDLLQERKKLMSEDPHYLIELVGVDDEYQGLGIGRRLVERACEIADDGNEAIYLQTSAAREFYTRRVGRGFVGVGGDGAGAGGSIVRPRRSKRCARDRS